MRLMVCSRISYHQNNIKIAYWSTTVQKQMYSDSLQTRYTVRFYWILAINSISIIVVTIIIISFTIEMDKNYAFSNLV